MTALFACFLTFCLAGTSADEIPQALDADDQCASPGCAVNALQRHVRGSEEELMEWHEDYYGHKPRSDISVSNYKSLMKNISVQQNAIMALWNRSLELEVEVQEQVKQVEHDSGLKVQDYVELVQDVDMSSREHHAKGDQQPREKMVKKWISYMDQEMGMVFKKLNANGQLVAACGTLMSKNPVPLKLQKNLRNLRCRAITSASEMSFGGVSRKQSPISIRLKSQPPTSRTTSKRSTRCLLTSMKESSFQMKTLMALVCEMLFTPAVNRSQSAQPR